MMSKILMVLLLGATFAPFGCGSSSDPVGGDCSGHVTIQQDPALEPCGPFTLTCTKDGVSVENSLDVPSGLAEFECFLTASGPNHIYYPCYPPVALVECDREAVATCYTTIPVTSNGVQCACPYPTGC